LPARPQLKRNPFDAPNITGSKPEVYRRSLAIWNANATNEELIGEQKMLLIYDVDV
jgi:hypothetical protein